jgi:hypothetical protein
MALHRPSVVVLAGHGASVHLTLPTKIETRE